jgi:hypothetical protein
MAKARIYIFLLSAVLWCISEKAMCQYKAPLDSSWLHIQVNKTFTPSVEGFSYDKTSPLGRNAQLMRAETYANKNKSATESGLWIKWKNQQFLYKDQSVYLIKNAGCSFEEVRPGKYGKKLRKTVNTLNKLYKKSAHARVIIETLQKSRNKFTISIVKCTDSYMLVPIPNGRLGVLNNNAYAFQAIERKQNIVEYAPFDQIGSGAEIRWGPKHKKIRLAHELSHAYDANFGLLDDRLIRVYGIVIPAREVRALYHENIIRKELGKQLRAELKNGMRAMVVDGVPHTYPLPIPARY